MTKKEATQIAQKQPLKILFLCEANSARSPIAEGFAREFFKEKVEARSAGWAPALVHLL